jgi:adenosylmethionine-8-amino-7-oxononanoate aminotransferase
MHHSRPPDRHRPAALADWQTFDREHIWHPYSSMRNPLPMYPVRRARGVHIELEDGRTLIDGMASWWAAIHGYNHPTLNAAIQQQLHDMAHIMFGGLTHRPAARLAAQLIELTPDPLQHVFFSDSGSVSVEVAIKMAIQYWQARGRPDKQRLLTVRSGYHGDTLGAMAVCDPVSGMHHLFAPLLMKHYFADPPACRSDAGFRDEHIASFHDQLQVHHQHIAAVILEPLVQGAGGMRIYCPEFLRQVRALCDSFGVLLILDEIATGFGRTGRLFACEHAEIAPDIMCLGKALTGGYMSLAATLSTEQVATGISDGDPGVFMHGPTFMANPLACSVASASIELLLEGPWQEKVARIEAALKTGLEPCRSLTHVTDVRVIGAIGVVELENPVDMAWIQPRFVDRGVWVRPFRNLVYLMPPYIVETDQLTCLTRAVCEVVAEIGQQ